MRPPRPLFLIALAASAVLAQAPTAPVIDPRGLLNGFTKLPAPATVARGGILHVNGFNLGPPEGATAGLPLPTTLGNPGVQVLINGRASPLLSATPGRIVTQVPWDAPLGLANVVVMRGTTRSRQAHFTVVAEDPSIRSADDSGYGVAGTLNGRTLTLSASGLGPTNPAVDSGAAGTTDPPVAPVDGVTVYIGGMKANATATLSPVHAGEFDIRVDVPASAKPGDAIALNVNPPAGPPRSANSVIFQGLRAPDVQFVKLPDGTPDLRTLTSTDLNGSYLVGTTARDAHGCSAAVLIDMARALASKVSDCFATANPAAPAVIAAIGTNVFGALVGSSPSGSAVILNPAVSDPLMVNLPG